MCQGFGCGLGTKRVSWWGWGTTGFQGTLLTEVIQNSLSLAMDLAGLTLSSKLPSGWDKSIHLSVFSKSILELEVALKSSSANFSSLSVFADEEQASRGPAIFQSPLLAFLVTLLQSSFFLLPFVSLLSFFTSYTLKEKHSDVETSNRSTLCELWSPIRQELGVACESFSRKQDAGCCTPVAYIASPGLGPTQANEESVASFSLLVILPLVRTHISAFIPASPHSCPTMY